MEAISIRTKYFKDKTLNPVIKGDILILHIIAEQRYLCQ